MLSRHTLNAGSNGPDIVCLTPVKPDVSLLLLKLGTISAPYDCLATVNNGAGVGLRRGRPPRPILFLNRVLRMGISFLSIYYKHRKGT